MHQHMRNTTWSRAWHNTIFRVLLIIFALQPGIVVEATSPISPCFSWYVYASTMASVPKGSFHWTKRVITVLSKSHPYQHPSMHGITMYSQACPGYMFHCRSSELRVVELLEDLCDSVKRGWTLVTIKTNSSDGSEKKTVHWEKIHSAPAGSRPDASEEEARQKQLSTYCGR